VREDVLARGAREAGERRRVSTEASRGAAGASGDPRADAVLRAFLHDGRLVAIPAAAGKRTVVLNYVVQLFEPGQRYPEKAVNAILRAVHPDQSALRRYLVDEGLMTRDSGVYWRTGGPVEV
jgi:hypothetical protein